ncbi:hypothetical protein B0H10DRAFT_1938391 [Mycena sp. CBHHK59/15]|nr:hypothetical protein B0H10DRAFT_1938391 [Mycena sp. CBHHK59/15]
MFPFDVASKHPSRSHESCIPDGLGTSASKPEDALAGMHWHALEPVIFQMLVARDADPARRPVVSPTPTESARLHRAARRYARFCRLAGKEAQSDLLRALPTLAVLELVHLVEGLRGAVCVLLGDSHRGRGHDKDNDNEHEEACDQDEDRQEKEYEDPDEYEQYDECDLDGGDSFKHDPRVSRLLSAGPANIWRLWNLRFGGSTCSAGFADALAQVQATGRHKSTFAAAFYDFEVARGLTAFDSARTRALFDAGHTRTAKALAQLEELMAPPPRPKAAQLRSLRLPYADDMDNDTTLPFLPIHLNRMPVRVELPYNMLELNGAPRIMPCRL